MVSRLRRLRWWGVGEPLDGDDANPLKTLRLSIKVNCLTQRFDLLQDQANVQLLLRKEHEGSAHPPANQLTLRDIIVQPFFEDARSGRAGGGLAEEAVGYIVERSVLRFQEEPGLHTEDVVR